MGEAPSMPAAKKPTARWKSMQLGEEQEKKYSKNLATATVKKELLLHLN
jgi:hypothetical protein